MSAVVRSWADLTAQHTVQGGAYLEFLRIPALSLGRYVLEVGAADPQQPHTEDEVYYVVAGIAQMTLGDESVPVATGNVIFVPMNVPHRFHDITARLELLVFFAPAEVLRS